LFFLGIPMLLLEFTLGQVLQRGNIAVWTLLNPRLKGLGIATCLANYIIILYYNVIISWTLILFFAAFRNPLPWSTQLTSNGTNKDCPDIYISEEYFYRDILHVYNDDCTTYNTQDSMGEGSTFQWQVFLCTLLTWLFCFFCVF
jgi:SNF family Na+-dependent transporter